MGITLVAGGTRGIQELDALANGEPIACHTSCRLAGWMRGNEVIRETKGAVQRVIHSSKKDYCQ